MKHSLYGSTQMESEQETTNQPPPSVAKHVHFSPEVEQKEVEREHEAEKGIHIHLIEFCPEDIQNSPLKRLFVSVYKYR